MLNHSIKVDLLLLKGGCRETLKRISKEIEYFYDVDLITQAEMEMSRYALNLLNETYKNNFKCLTTKSLPASNSFSTLDNLNKTSANVTCNPNVTHYKTSVLHYEYNMAVYGIFFYLL